MKIDKILKFFIAVFGATSIIMISLGILKLLAVDNDIKIGITQIECVQHSSSPELEDNNYFIDKIIDHTNEYQTKPLGLLTFKDYGNYKTAIYKGISKQNLKYGAAWACGTAEPCSNGNCTLYGHRDSAFKPIPKLKKGDIILVEYNSKRLDYKVSNIYVCEPNDNRIRQSSNNEKLTLVTCYPFSFVGPAPQRCIVECYAMK